MKGRIGYQELSEELKQIIINAGNNSNNTVGNIIHSTFTITTTEPNDTILRMPETIDVSKVEALIFKNSVYLDESEYTLSTNTITLLFNDCPMGTEFNVILFSTENKITYTRMALVTTEENQRSIKLSGELSMINELVMVFKNDLYLSPNMYTLTSTSLELAFDSEIDVTYNILVLGNIGFTGGASGGGGTGPTNPEDCKDGIVVMNGDIIPDEQRVQGTMYFRVTKVIDNTLEDDFKALIIMEQDISVVDRDEDTLYLRESTVQASSGTITTGTEVVNTFIIMETDIPLINRDDDFIYVKVTGEVIDPAVIVMKKEVIPVEDRNSSSLYFNMVNKSVIDSVKYSNILLDRIVGLDLNIDPSDRTHEFMYFYKGSSVDFDDTKAIVVMADELPLDQRDEDSLYFHVTSTGTAETNSSDVDLNLDNVVALYRELPTNIRDDSTLYFNIKDEQTTNE